MLIFSFYRCHKITLYWSISNLKRDWHSFSWDFAKFCLETESIRSQNPNECTAYKDRQSFSTVFIWNWFKLNFNAISFFISKEREKGRKRVKKTHANKLQCSTMVERLHKLSAGFYICIVCSACKVELIRHLKTLSSHTIKMKSFSIEFPLHIDRLVNCWSLREWKREEERRDWLNFLRMNEMTKHERSMFIWLSVVFYVCQRHKKMSGFQYEANNFSFPWYRPIWIELGFH